MKKIIMLLVLSLFIAGTPGFCEEKVFQIDPVHSTIEFRIRHLYTTFVGRFNTFEGTIAGNPAIPSTMRVTASVDVSSIYTNNVDREKHLRSSDFFDTENFPKATFESTKTTPDKKKDFGAVTGKLTIRGITKEVTFKGQFLGKGIGMKGVSLAGFHATTTINREDFGVSYNATLPTGITVLGTEVELVLDLEAFEVKPGDGTNPQPPAKKSETTTKPLDMKAQEEILKAETDLLSSGKTEGLKVGDLAPDFSLPDMAGKTVTLQESLRKGPVVLVFYRGEWCSFCNVQLRTLEDAFPEIQKLGASLIAISPQTEEKSSDQSGKNNLTFPLLTDKTGNTMNAYHLLYEVPEKLQKLYREKLGVDLENYNGEGGWHLPVTATYIIDRKGIIRAGLVDFDYTKRMAPAEITAALKNLQ